MKKLILFLALFAFWFSCKKDKPKARFEPYGQVLEFGTKKPVPNASVWLIHCESVFLGPENCWTVLTDTTDAEGRYSFEYDQNDSFLALTTAADGYFEKGASGRLNISAGKRQYDFELYAHSHLDLKIINTRDTTILLSYDVQSPDYPSYFPNLIMKSDSVVSGYFLTAGESPIMIFYVLKTVDGKILESYTDTIICPAHNVLSHTINL